MVKNVRKIIMYGALGGIIFSVGDANCTELCSCKPLYDFGHDQGAQMAAKIHTDCYTGTWAEGTLTKEPRYLGLMAGGKCYFGGKEKILDIEVTSANQTPNLVRLNEKHELAFKKPEPACWFNLPNGHDARVYVCVDGVEVNFPSVRNYICLGVKFEGKEEYEARLFNLSDLSTLSSDYPEHAVAELDLSDKDVVQLIPLVSRKNLESGYEAVDINNTIIGNGIEGLGIPERGNFDFSNAFKVTLKCFNIPWVNVSSLENISSFFAVSYANGIFFSLTENEIQLSDNNLEVWNKSPLPNKLQGKKYTPIIYSEINSVGHYITADEDGIIIDSSRNDEKNWDLYSEELKLTYQEAKENSNDEIGEVKYLIDLGEGEVLATTDNFWLSRSLNGGMTWSPAVQFVTDSEYGKLAAMAYGDGILVAVTEKGGVTVSNSKGEEWKPLANSLDFLISSKNPSSENNVIKSLAFGSGRFYATNARGHFACSSDGEDWIDFGLVIDLQNQGSGSAPNEYIEQLIHGNGGFYLVSDQGNIYTKSGGNEGITAGSATTEDEEEKPQRLDRWEPFDCSLNSSIDRSLADGDWHNHGSLGVGTIRYSTGDKQNQLLAVHEFGQLRSLNGIQWNNLGFVDYESMCGWDNAPVYGGRIGSKEVWCISGRCGMRYSIDGAQTWQKMADDSINSNGIGRNQPLAFGGNTFMTFDKDNFTWTAALQDPLEWKKLSNDKVTHASAPITALGYNQSTASWLCIVSPGHTYELKDGETQWTKLGESLAGIAEGYWYGACYAHGNFYAVQHDGDECCVANSPNGKIWEPIYRTTDQNHPYHNITFYRNQLILIDSKGEQQFTGFFESVNE